METDQQPDADAATADGDANEQPPSPSAGETPQVNNGGEKGEGKSAARKVTLSYEKYRRIANTLILFMRQEEDKISSKCWCDLPRISIFLFT